MTFVTKGLLWFLVAISLALGAVYLAPQAANAADAPVCQNQSFDEFEALPAEDGMKELRLRGQDARDFHDAAATIGNPPPESLDEFYLVMNEQRAMVAYGRGGCVLGISPIDPAMVKAIAERMKEIKTKREGDGI